MNNITVDAELWETIQRKGDDGSSWLEDIKIEDRTFVLSPEDFSGKSWSDGFNSAVLYPKVSGWHVKINNVSIETKK